MTTPAVDIGDTRRGDANVKILESRNLVTALAQVFFVFQLFCVTANVADAGLIQAYVSNFTDNSVSVIDPETNSVTATIPVGERPVGVVGHPDGSRVYVANRNSNTMSVIDTLTNEVTATVPMAGGPFGIDISPDGSRVYVANRNVGLIQVVDTETNIVISNISASATGGVAVHPDGGLIYATAGEQISVIDAATNDVVDSVQTNLTGGAWSMRFHPDGSRLYVNNAPVFTPLVGVIDVGTNTQSSRIQVGRGATGITVHPDGNSVYISNRDEDTISVIDTETDLVTDTISVATGSNPRGLAVHPNGRWLYVANKNKNSVSTIDLQTNELLTTIPMGRSVGEYITIVDNAQFVADFGDFSSNGMLGIGDLDLLTAAIQAESTDLQFDVDENSLVDISDRQYWVTEIKKTWIGDSNLDRVFDMDDLVEVIQAGEYEDGVALNSTWATGDWNGDREFDKADLIAALQDGGYLAGAQTAVSAVPEPSATILLAIGLIGLCCFRKST